MAMAIIAGMQSGTDESTYGQNVNADSKIGDFSSWKFQPYK